MKLALVFVFTIFLVSPAQAALRVSLITVGPGVNLLEAFGHVALAVQDTESRSPVIVYEYTGVAPHMILKERSPVKNVIELLNSKSQASVITTTLERFRARYLSRKMMIERLELSNHQAEALVKAVRDDAAANHYSYGLFSSNCATRLRDHIFSVLPQDSRISHDRKTRETTKSIVIAAIETATASSPSRRVELPIQTFARGAANAQQAQVLMTAYGIPTSLRSAKDFDQAFSKFDTLVQTLAKSAEQTPQLLQDLIRMPKSEIELLPKLAKALHKITAAGELNQNLTAYDAMFTPQRLREGLLKTKNGSRKLVKSSAR